MESREARHQRGGEQRSPDEDYCDTPEGDSDT
jgi:hypothetical protein